MMHGSIHHKMDQPAIGRKELCHNNYLSNRSSKSPSKVIPNQLASMSITGLSMALSELNEASTHNSSDDTLLSR
eukprot:2102107-Ditylum_brightwellii.AAC.1